MSAPQTHIPKLSSSLAAFLTIIVFLNLSSVADTVGAQAHRAPAVPTSQDGDQRQFGRRLRSYERNTNNFLMWENIPGARESFKGAEVTINRWGMRDVDYPLIAPKGTYRIALLGSSMTVGAGVPLEQTMESLLEQRLNRERTSATKRRYEILNFSVGGYGILQSVAVADQRAMRFKPDAFFVGVFSNEISRMSQFLLRLVKGEYAIPYPYVRQKLKEAGVSPDMEEPELRRRLRPITTDLVKWSYARLAQHGREAGIPVVGLVLPEPRPRSGRNIDEVAALAAGAGLPLVDLRNVYDGRNVDEYRLGGAEEDADPHWNPAGHLLIANRIYDLLQQNDAQLLRLNSRK